MPDKLITSTGDNVFEKMICPGLDYDAVADKMVGWSEDASIGVSKQDVYSLDLDEQSWTCHKPAWSNKVIPSDENQWGTWGRWRYVSSRNVFILYNRVSDNVYLYRHTSWRDTLAIQSLHASAPATIEQYLTVPATAVVKRMDNSTDTVTNSCTYRSLDTLIVTMNGNYITAKNLGTVKIVVRKSTAKSIALDTITVTVVSSTALLDSITLSIDSVRIFAGDSYQVHAIGYFHKGTQNFKRNIDDDAVWSTTSSAEATVVKGNVKGVAAGGYIAIKATMAGKSRTVWVKVWPHLSFVKRINFQVTLIPWSYGWVADNGGNYDPSSGYGWISGQRDVTRDDRLGAFPIASFVAPSSGAEFKINAPNGKYIIKVAAGNNTYGINSIDSVLFGTNRVCYKPSGTGNGINVNTITVAGGNGAVFSVYGSINYIVMISDEGVDINEVAEDKGDPVPLSPYVGIKEQGQNTDLSELIVAPNPFNSIAKIGIPATVDVKNATLQVFDIYGKLVADLTSSLADRVVQFNAEFLSEGIYLVRLNAGNKMYAKKLICLKQF